VVTLPRTGTLLPPDENDWEGEVCGGSDSETLSACSNGPRVAVGRQRRANLAIRGSGPGTLPSRGKLHPASCKTNYANIGSELCQSLFPAVDLPAVLLRLRLIACVQALSGYSMRSQFAQEARLHSRAVRLHEAPTLCPPLVGATPTDFQAARKSIGHT
jgi:hypothetical protein